VSRFYFEMACSRASEKYGLSPALLKAVIHVESRFDKNAVSHKGATGLMQLMPETAKQVGVHDPFDPSENIMGGARLLREYIERFGSLKKALVAYNAGPAYVFENRKLPTETQVYLVKVVRRFKFYLAE
jgi:soluble lytic murein transglycosylase